MVSILYGLCAAVGLSVLVYTLRLQRRSPSKPRQAMCFAFGAFTAGITVAIPPVAAGIDHLIVTNTAKVISHGCLMVVVANAQTMLLYLAQPYNTARVRVRRWTKVIIASYAGMLILFAATFTLQEPVRLTVEYAREPLVTAYLLVYIAVFFSYAISLCRLSWQFSNVTRRLWLRRGMRSIAVGAAVSMLYLLNKTGYLLAYASGLHPRGEEQIAAVLVTIAALPMLLGLTLPAWGPLLEVVPKMRRYRRLHPLWHDLITEFPDLELDPSLRRLPIVIRDIDYALTRRTAEIRDARLALMPYVDRSIAAEVNRRADATGLAASDRQAVVEAAQFAAAIRAHRSGRPAAQPQPPDEFHRPTGGQREEIAWLVQIAAAYARSSLIASDLAATAPARLPPTEPETR